MAEHDLIENFLTSFDFYTLFGTIVSSIFTGIMLPFLLQWVWKKKETSNIIKDMKSAIKHELERNLRELEKENHARTENTDGSTTTMSFNLETFVFDSAIHSGNFILFEEKLRAKLSEIYDMVKLANRQLDRVTKHNFSVYHTDIEKINWTSIRDLQEKNLQEKHDDIKKKIKEVIKLL